MKSKLISLEATNVKRLRAVRIEFADGVTVIGGRNGQGKSSVLDSIEMALAGKKSLPPKPIREGEDSARIVLEMDTLRVTRKFTANNSYLEVAAKDGAKYPSPQSILDDLYNGICVDPVSFLRMPPAEQAEMLRRVAGVATDDLDGQFDEVYKERTLVSRDLKTQESTLRSMTYYHDAPKDEVSLRALHAEFDDADRDLHEAKDQWVKAERDIETHRQMKERIAEAERKLAEMRAEREAFSKKMLTIKDEHKAMDRFEEARKRISEIRTKIVNSEDTNERVRSNAAHARATEILESLKKKQAELNSELDAIRSEKAERVAAARFPVDGLSVSESGVVLYNGVPFSQASQAEKIRVSAAVGLSLNPSLPILLIRDGSLLDDDAMLGLRQIAEEHGAQILVERVGQGDSMAVVIEDGLVAGSET